MAARDGPRRAETQQYRDFFWGPYNLALIAALRRERDEALRWLETAYEKGWRGWPTIDIADDPFLEGLQDDPRFQELCNRVLADVERMRLQARQDAE